MSYKLNLVYCFWVHRVLKSQRTKLGTRAPIALWGALSRTWGRGTFLELHVTWSFAPWRISALLRLLCRMWKMWVGIRWSSLHTTGHFPFAFVFIISGVPKCFVLCVLSPCTFPFPLPSSFQVKASIPFFWLLFCVSFLFGLPVLRSPTRVYNFSCFTVVVRFFFCMCPLLRRLFI